MKTIVILIVGLFIFKQSYSQVAYYDALQLIGEGYYDDGPKLFKINVDENNVHQIIEVFSDYGFISDFEVGESIPIEKLVKELEEFVGTDNPFIGFTGSGQSGEEFILEQKGIAASLSKIGGLDVTNIVQGLSQFMIDRAKQELTVAFFNRFKKFVDNNPEIQVLFPKTTDVLKNLLGYNYPEMLPVLRTSFNEDLNSMPYHLDDILKLPKYRALLEELPEVRVAIKSIRLVHELQLGEKHPADIITAFAELEEWTHADASDELKNMGNAIALGSIFSEGLRYSSYSTTEKNYDRMIDTLKLINYGEKATEEGDILKFYSATDRQVTLFLDEIDDKEKVKYYQPDNKAESKDVERLPSNKSMYDYKTEVLKLDAKKIATQVKISETKTVTTNRIVEDNQTYEITEVTTETETDWLAQDGDSLLKEEHRESSTTRERISGSKTRAWISLDQLEELTKDKIAFRVFLGLLYQKIKDYNDTGVQFVVAGDTKPFTDVMKDNRDNLFLFQNQFTEFIELGERVEKAKDDIIAIRSSDNKPSNDQLFEYINSSIDVIEYSFGLASLLDGNIEIDDYVDLARKGNELFKHIYQKEYASAINDGVDILETTIGIIEKNSFKKIDKSEIRTALLKLPDVKRRKQKRILNSLEKDSFEKIKTTNCSQKSIEDVRKEIANSGLSRAEKAELTSAIAHVRLAKLREILSEISKYGIFMANMVNAESPEEVKAVLENVVLPVGSSSIKKNAKFNIAVQSYLGAYLSPQALGSNSKKETTAWNQPWGVTAPIGFSFSWGFKKCGSASVFISLFDIGAIVDYDLQTDSISASSSNMTVETSKEYKIELGQIFSPGAFAIYGFGGNLPLSLGVGAQYGPGIFDISSTEGSLVNENPYWRFSVTLTVDIPLFNLHHKPKEFRTFKN